MQEIRVFLRLKKYISSTFSIKHPNLNTNATKRPFLLQEKPGVTLSYHLSGILRKLQVWKSGNSCSLGKDIQARIHSPIPLLLTPRNKELGGSPILDK